MKESIRSLDRKSALWQYDIVSKIASPRTRGRGCFALGLSVGSERMQPFRAVPHLQRLLAQGTREGLLTPTTPEIQNQGPAAVSNNAFYA